MGEEGGGGAGENSIEFVVVVVVCEWHKGGGLVMRLTGVWAGMS